MATLKNTTINDTGFITYPLGNTVQRPASPASGMIRFNSTEGYYEGYNSITWVQLGETPIVTNGLRLYLDASIPASYPGTGTTWRDLSGNNFNGTLVNGVSYVRNNGGGLFFDNSDDYINLPYAILSGTGDFTINQWIQCDDAENAGTTFANYPAGTLQMFYGKNVIGLWLNNASTYLGTPPYNTPLPQFTTNPVMFTTQRSGTTTSLYFNAELQLNGSSSANIGEANFRIGTNTSTTEQYLGRVYITQVYNRALSLAEIRQNFNATRQQFGL